MRHRLWLPRRVHGSKCADRSNQPPRRRALRLQPLECREVLAVFTVTDDGDSGPGTLRQAILDANAASGADVVEFNIGGPDKTIALSSPLPAITDQITIDGRTQDPLATHPVVMLDGTGAGTGADGLVVSAGFSTIRSLALGNFSGAGVKLESDNNFLYGNYLGATQGGATAAPNGVGVLIADAGTNFVGSATAGDGNLISANTTAGIRVSGTNGDGNVIQGNRIGTNATADAALGSQAVGVLIEAGGQNNLIGAYYNAADRLAGNVISGNSVAGVKITGAGASNNWICANLIGTDGEGGAAVSNGDGVVIAGGASSNAVGVLLGETLNALLGNVISGNSGDGVEITGQGSDSNYVAGNIIGADLALSTPLGNQGHGVLVDDQAAAAMIGDNVQGSLGEATQNIVAASGAAGIAFLRGSQGNASRNFVVINSDDGVLISESDGVTVGGGSAGGNTIVGNGKNGIHITGTGANWNRVAGNFIGIEVDDNDEALPDGNTEAGVRIDAGAVGNVVGLGYGDSDLDLRNTISANGQDGVLIIGAGTNDNVVGGNVIGLDPSGEEFLGNGGSGVEIAAGAAGNIVGLTYSNAHANQQNLISANTHDGVTITGAGTTGNLVAGNRIGTDAAGQLWRGNQVGVRIVDGASANTIGLPWTTDDTRYRNQISGNVQEGVLITGAGSMNNVWGNVVGLATDGGYLGNGSHGVSVIDSGPQVIGVANHADGFAHQGNVISANQGDGIRLENTTEWMQVSGNYIGTDSAGTGFRGNRDYGVHIVDNVQNPIIGLAYGGGGGVYPIQGNLISANQQGGVRIDGVNSGVSIAGNTIGADVQGDDWLGNQGPGILLAEGVTDVTIGIGDGGWAPVDARFGNLISANNGSGIRLAGDNTGVRVSGNKIGTSADGNHWLGNAGDGITLLDGAIANSIGLPHETDSDDPIYGNLIAANGGDGISISGSSSFLNLIAGNRIGTNAAATGALGNVGSGVRLSGGAHHNVVGVLVLGAGAENESVDPAEANLIAGNQGDGVTITGSGTASNYVSGNGIGVTDLGEQPIFISNQGDGLAILDGASNNGVGVVAFSFPLGPFTITGLLDVAQRNFIAANQGNGVAIRDDGTDNNVVAGNSIGVLLDAGGTMGNNAAGVLIADGATNNRIGNDAAGSYPALSWSDFLTDNGAGVTVQNVIVGSVGSGVVVQNTQGNNVSGNLIAANGQHGILIDASADVVVGGTTLAASNVIGANQQDGIRITDAASSGNILTRNYVGVLPAVEPLTIGNLGGGVRIVDAADNRIGDFNNIALANTIANNAESGVIVDGGDGNAVVHNLISGNAWSPTALSPRAIKLLNNANDAQPGPILSSAILSTNAGTTSVTVTYSVDDSAGSGPLRIEFYGVNSTGAFLLGTASYNNALGGPSTATFDLPSGNISQLPEIMATATDPDDNTSASTELSLADLLVTVANPDPLELRDGATEAELLALIDALPDDVAALIDVVPLAGGGYTMVMNVSGIRFEQQNSLRLSGHAELHVSTAFFDLDGDFTTTGMPSVTIDNAIFNHGARPDGYSRLVEFTGGDIAFTDSTLNEGNRFLVRGTTQVALTNSLFAQESFIKEPSNHTWFHGRLDGLIVAEDGAVIFDQSQLETHADVAVHDQGALTFQNSSKIAMLTSQSWQNGLLVDGDATFDVLHSEIFVNDGWTTWDYTDNAVVHFTNVENTHTPWQVSSGDSQIYVTNADTFSDTLIDRSQVWLTNVDNVFLEYFILPGAVIDEALPVNVGASENYVFPNQGEFGIDWRVHATDSHFGAYGIDPAPDTQIAVSARPGDDTPQVTVGITGFVGPSDNWWRNVEFDHFQSSLSWLPGASDPDLIAANTYDNQTWVIGDSHPATLTLENVLAVNGLYGYPQARQMVISKQSIVSDVAGAGGDGVKEIIDSSTGLFIARDDSTITFTNDKNLDDDQSSAYHQYPGGEANVTPIQDPWRPGRNLMTALGEAQAIQNGTLLLSYAELRFGTLIANDNGNAPGSLGHGQVFAHDVVLKNGIDVNDQYGNANFSAATPTTTVDITRAVISASPDKGVRVGGYGSLTITDSDVDTTWSIDNTAHVFLYDVTPTATHPLPSQPNVVIGDSGSFDYDQFDDPQQDIAVTGIQLQDMRGSTVGAVNVTGFGHFMIDDQPGSYASTITNSLTIADQGFVSARRLVVEGAVSLDDSSRARFQDASLTQGLTATGDALVQLQNTAIGTLAAPANLTVSSTARAILQDDPDSTTPGRLYGSLVVADQARVQIFDLIVGDDTLPSAGDVFVGGQSRVTIHNVEIWGDVYVDGDANVYIDNSVVHGVIYVSGQAAVYVDGAAYEAWQGPEIYSHVGGVHASDAALVLLGNVEVDGDVSADESAEVNLRGAIVDGAVAVGDTADLTLAEATVAQSLSATGHGRVVASGASIGLDVSVQDAAVALLTDTDIGGVLSEQATVAGTPMVVLDGGAVDAILAEGGQVYLYGLDVQGSPSGANTVAIQADAEARVWAYDSELTGDVAAANLAAVMLFDSTPTGVATGDVYTHTLSDVSPASVQHGTSASPALNDEIRVTGSLDVPMGWEHVWLKNSEIAGDLIVHGNTVVLLENTTVRGRIIQLDDSRVVATVPASAEPAYGAVVLGGIQSKTSAQLELDNAIVQSLAVHGGTAELSDCVVLGGVSSAGSASVSLVSSRVYGDALQTINGGLSFDDSILVGDWQTQSSADAEVLNGSRVTGNLKTTYPASGQLTIDDSTVDADVVLASNALLTGQTVVGRDLVIQGGVTDVSQDVIVARDLLIPLWGTVNLNGAHVQGDLNMSAGTANLDGATIDGDAVASFGTINASDATIDGDLALSGGWHNLTGQIQIGGSLIATGSANLNLRAATVSSPLLASGSATVSVYSSGGNGSALQDLVADELSVVTVTDSDVEGDLTARGSSRVSVQWGAAVLGTTTAEEGSVLAVRFAQLDGLLTVADTAFALVSLQSELVGIAAFDNAVATVSQSELDGPASASGSGTIYLLNVNRLSGSDSGNVIVDLRDPPKLYRQETVSGALTVAGSDALDLLGATVQGNVGASGQSRLWTAGGTIVQGNVALQNDAWAELTNTIITGNLDINGTRQSISRLQQVSVSNVSVAGRAQASFESATVVSSDVSVADDAHANLYGATVNGELAARGRATISAGNAQIASLVVEDDAVVYLDAATLTTLGTNIVGVVTAVGPNSYRVTAR